MSELEFRAMVEDLRIQRGLVETEARRRFPSGCFVRVDCDQFKGFGIAMSGYDLAALMAGSMPVRLENGNTWNYPLDTISSVESIAIVPRSVRRAKLQMKGIKCLPFHA